MGEAARRWAEELEAWAIPQEILDAAPESPWGFPPALFAVAGDPGAAPESPSTRRAAEALPSGGTVLDVGAGGGAGSIPLAGRAGRLIAVDQSEDMLAAFASKADDVGVAHEEICGLWPDVAARAPVADVVVCHHVLYNVADAVPFLEALTDHARRRVVMEMTEVHPQVATAPLWRHFHGLARPAGPRADDALAVLAEMGLEVSVERFRRDPHPAHRDRAEWVAFTRRRLCLAPGREPEVEAQLGEGGMARPQELVALWWDGRAR